MAHDHIMYTLWRQICQKSASALAVTRVSFTVHMDMMEVAIYYSLMSYLP